MTKEMYRAAKEYQKRGFIIIPLESPIPDIPIEKMSKSEIGRLGKKPLMPQFTKRKKKFSKKELKMWFLHTTNNIGILCGKRNGLIIFDFDDIIARKKLFKGIDINTRRDRRIKTRDHTWFKYDKRLSRTKTGEIKGHKFEVCSNGKQVVCPPSIHREGQHYKWVDDSLEVEDMPERLIKRILKAIGGKSNKKHVIHDNFVRTSPNESERALNEKIKAMSDKKKIERLNKIIYTTGCRMWIQGIYADRAIVHIPEDKTTEEIMLKIASELKRNGAIEEDMHTFAKIMLNKTYDRAYTSLKWSYVNPMLTATNDSLLHLPHRLQKYVQYIRRK